MATDDELKAHAEKAKILRVRQLIVALLVEHDICGEITLCGKDHVNVFSHLDASWSAIRLVKDEKEGYLLKVGDGEAQPTANMVRSFFEIHAHQLAEWAQASAYVDQQMGASGHLPMQNSDSRSEGTLQ